MLTPAEYRAAVIWWLRYGRHWPRPDLVELLPENTDTVTLTYEQLNELLTAVRHNARQR